MWFNSGYNRLFLYSLDLATHSNFVDIGDKMKDERCPICDKGFLRRVVQNETYTYKGVSKVIPDCISFKCTVCEETIMDKEDMKRSSKILKKFKREVDNDQRGE